MSQLNVALPEYVENKMKDAGYYFNDDLVDQNISEEIIKLIPIDLVTKYRIVPICIEDGNLIIVTSTEQTLKNSNRLVKELNRNIKLLLAEDENVKMALNHYYKITAQNIYRGDMRLSTENDSTPLKRKVETILQDAAKRKASDIHLRPTEYGMCVEFRINGHLIDFTEEYNISRSEIENTINIIKGKDISGNANASKINQPNSGGFNIIHGDTVIDIRLSTVPLASLAGDSFQKVNLRLLPQEKKAVKLDALGYSANDLKAIRTALIKSSAGMFLISGKVGSGKTTSLYAQIEDVLDTVKEPLNVMTIENPVEIHDSRFCQIQVREAVTEELSLSAPKILKVCLRQDPNIILYGEIRDKTDAEVAIEAAETGHKVFSTVHAKNCVATIARLLDLGVSRASLLSELNLIISQKLVGVLCPYCSQSHVLTEREKLILSDKEIDILLKANLREPGSPEKIKQCKYCNGGYTQRTVIAEYIQFDTELRDTFLKQNLTFSEIQSILDRKNFRSMWEKVFDLVVVGQVDLMEAIKVVGKD